jgi:hypothetical protein
MLAATPGPSWSSLRARLRSSRSAFWRRQVPRLGAAPGGPTQQAADLRVEPALDQIVDQRLDDSGIFVRALDQAERMLIAVAVTPRAYRLKAATPLRLFQHPPGHRRISSSDALSMPV